MEKDMKITKAKQIEFIINFFLENKILQKKIVGFFRQIFCFSIVEGLN